MFSNLHPIDQIKDLIENENLSFLIGAGFSKNISPDFPLWRELLADAIWEKYGTGKENERKKKEKAIADKVIREHGLLGVASKIVSDAGFHEAVDYYIEQHIPYLALANDGSVVIKIAGNELEGKASLECHQLLRQLNIKNIYTFNYDNALEFCLGDKRVYGIEKKKLEEELERRKREIESLREEYGSFLQEAEQIKISTSELTSGSVSPDSKKSVGEYRDLENLEKMNHEFSERLKELNSMVFNLAVRVGEVQKKLDDSYLVISKSSDITQTDEGRNIFKIHSSLRLNQNEEYGFDGDKHSHYIITQDDYENYERKHSAFVNLMRIDLLRKRFCIIGVSGSDANFLAWIGWVKDVLDKTGNEDGIQQKHSFFVYAGNDSLSTDMKQMLENHFIIPVILKDYFKDAKDDTERVKKFLEYIQPSINNTIEMVRLWKIVDRRNLESTKSLSIDEVSLKQLCKLSNTNVFFKPLSIVHYAAVGIENSAYYNLKDAVDEKLKVIIAAMRCSMLPIRPILLKELTEVLHKSKDSYIKEGLGYVTRRHKLLYNPDSLTKSELAEDRYTSILSRLYLYDFPSERECTFECKTGLDHIRLYSLQRLLYDTSSIDLKDNRIVSLFANPQELTLANDWLNMLTRDIDSPIGDAARRSIKKYNTYHLSEYVDSYLKEMREKKEPETYGKVSNTIYLGGRGSGYENAAVLLNSLIELGVTFAERAVLSDNDWIDLAHELMPYHPYSVSFYTIARGSKDSVINRVAQELMYEGHSYEVASNVLKRILEAICCKNVPDWMIEPMAQFAKCLFVAVPVSRWGKIFKEKILLYLDYANKKAHYNTQKAIYEMISAGVEYIKDKQIKLVLLKHVLQAKVNERTGNFLNALAISAKDGVTVKDFAPLSKLLVDFAQKKNGRMQAYILFNLSSLLNRDDLLKVSDVLAEQALNDNYLAVPYAYLIKNIREKSSAIKDKIAEREDVWQSGISDTGARIGDGYVKVSQIDKILHFSKTQASHIWDDLVETLKKVNARLDRSRNPKVDQGMFSSENTFREIVMDMRLFVHRHSDYLQRKPNFNEVVTDLENTYYRCCFNKTILQMISDDETYRAIRRMMTETEIGGIESLSTEYKALVSCLLSKESAYVNYLFLHLSWVIKDHKDFFSQQEFVALFIAILDSYQKYFMELDKQDRWNIRGCEKEIAEKCLIEISKVLTEWGYKHPFWSAYKKKFFVK